MTDVAFGSRRPRTTAVVTALVLFALPISASTCECTAVANDARVIERVQSSWTAGYSSVQAGNYALALRELRSTAKFLPLIRDTKARACVAAGASNLIGSAAAGEQYRFRHPRDPAGARAAAQRAWHVFVHCP